MNILGEYFRHSADMELMEVPFHYKRCGLDNIYLLNGFEAEIDEDGERFVSVLDVDSLHQAIGLHLVRNRKTLAPKEIRFLRRTMDLTQAELGRMIGQNSQQIARWEKGENNISGPADRLIRLMFRYSVLGDEETQQEPMQFLDEIDNLDSSPEGDLRFCHQGQDWLEKAA